MQTSHDVRQGTPRAKSYSENKASMEMGQSNSGTGTDALAVNLDAWQSCCIP